MSIDNEKAWKELITALALVLDLQEDLNYYHAWRVAVISTLLAEEILPALWKLWQSSRTNNLSYVQTLRQYVVFNPAK